MVRNCFRYRPSNSNARDEIEENVEENQITSIR